MLPSRIFRVHTHFERLFLSIQSSIETRLKWAECTSHTTWMILVQKQCCFIQCFIHWPTLALFWSQYQVNISAHIVKNFTFCQIAFQKAVTGVYLTEIRLQNCKHFWCYGWDACISFSSVNMQNPNKVNLSKLLPWQQTLQFLISIFPPFNAVSVWWVTM